VFPDHYPFTVSDFKQIEPFVVMTEKDAVKCAAFAASSMYFLPIEAKIDRNFWDALWTHPAIRALA
jgi:tetraacyldisaccharide 4'-kinase